MRGVPGRARDQIVCREKNQSELIAASSVENLVQTESGETFQMYLLVASIADGNFNNIIRTPVGISQKNINTIHKNFAFRAPLP